VPFPRVGRAGASLGLVPFPRVGRGGSRSMGLVPLPRVGRPDPGLELLPEKRQSLIPYPRIGKKSLQLDRHPWEVLLEEMPLQQAAQMPEPRKRNWDAPRLGGYKKRSSGDCRPGHCRPAALRLSNMAFGLGDEQDE